MDNEEEIFELSKTDDKTQAICLALLEIAKALNRIADSIEIS